RDATGFGVDIALDPFTWIGRGTNAHTDGTWARTALNALDERSSLLDAIDSVKKTALDPYATFRSLYRQNRAGKLEKLRDDKRGTIPIWMPQAKTRKRVGKPETR